MKLNKKITSLLCAAALMLSLLTGCGTSATTENLVTPKSAPRTDSSSSETLASQDSQTESTAQSSTGTQAAGTEQETAGAAQAAEAADAGSITEAKAKEIALNHAGFTEDQVTNLKVKLDRDDGRDEYDVKFQKDGTEYDYEIDAVTGDIFKYDAETSKHDNTQASDTAGSASITEAKAKEIALNHAGFTEDQVTSLTAKLDQDDGRKEYEVEFWKDSTEYDYEIDASTGDILKYDVENKANGSTQTSDTTVITEAKAKEIALNHAGLTESQVTNLKVKLDQDDGRKEYEVEFRKDKTEYDYEINASTGDIISYEIDVD